MSAFVLVAVLAGVGLLRLGMLLVPPRPDAAAQLRRWDLARSRTQPTPGVRPDTARRPIAARLTAAAVDALTRRGVDLTTVGQDLAITGSSLEQHLARILTLMVAALLAPSALGALALAAGVPVGFGLPLLIGLGLAAVIGALAHRDLRQAADRRREEFRRSLSIYLDLVSMSMEAGRGHPEALPAAASIGQGWTFELLADAIATARYSGITAWAAFGDLGHRLGIGELVDLSASLTLAADEGSKIKASLTARAETLRAKRLTDAEGQAKQASESMQFALLVMVFTFIAYQMYPPIVGLLTG